LSEHLRGEGGVGCKGGHSRGARALGFQDVRINVALSERREREGKGWRVGTEASNLCGGGGGARWSIFSLRLTWGWGRKEG
jgi:hypothetical protein